MRPRAATGFKLLTNSAGLTIMELIVVVSVTAVAAVVVGAFGPKMYRHYQWSSLVRSAENAIRLARMRAIMKGAGDSGVDVVTVTFQPKTKVESGGSYTIKETSTDVYKKDASDNLILVDGKAVKLLDSRLVEFQYDSTKYVITDQDPMPADPVPPASVSFTSRGYTAGFAAITLRVFDRKQQNPTRRIQISRLGKLVR